MALISTYSNTTRFNREPTTKIGNKPSGKIVVPSALPFNPDAWEPEKNPEYVAWIKRVAATPEFKGVHGPCAARDALYSWYQQGITCYSYALGDRTNFISRAIDHARPGILHQRKTEPSAALQWPESDRTTSEVTFKELYDDDVRMHCAVSMPSMAFQLTQLDGHKPTGNNIIHEPDSYPIALHVWPGKDFHYMRQDEDGTWSQCFQNQRPRKVRCPDGSFVTDPSKISIFDEADPDSERRGPRRIIENPNQKQLDGHYNFVSFFNVSRNLTVPIAVVGDMLLKKVNRIFQKNEALAALIVITRRELENFEPETKRFRISQLG